MNVGKAIVLNCVNIDTLSRFKLLFKMDANRYQISIQNNKYLLLKIHK